MMTIPKHGLSLRDELSIGISFVVKMLWKNVWNRCHQFRKKGFFQASIRRDDVSSGLTVGDSRMLESNLDVFLLRITIDLKEIN